MGGKVTLAATAELEVQVSAERVQVQPDPDSAVAVKPAGRVSMTVIVPLVELVPALPTVRV